MESKTSFCNSQSLHCAIIGSSGTGKSSFVNTIRGLTCQDINAAKVDVVECTTRPTLYTDRKNPSLNYWDLPGVGTPNFPKETYLSQINFERYNFFLIITATRFTENDIWLASQVKKAGRSFFFIRTKIDIDLWNKKRCCSRYNESATLKEIRDDCLKKLRADFHVPVVFLISNFHPEKYDFPDLCLNLRQI
ncbi:interferon-gamma-inducible GTPase 10-like [Hydractinia symbiolongicarpus]|uniref:interferon-gamma-inducible GTPase 10-like n=1 Tax=Hydractinia symbiolongicarpus TaxID=13093 RepID=UPI0025505075|nr:interferon-gamma-inducible GTPase 10-like [Hydractinia symbiolongicarpus]